MLDDVDSFISSGGAGAGGGQVQPVGGGEIVSGWAQSLHGRLAAIILCDQFSKSIYRKDVKRFDYDIKAIKLVRDVVGNENNKKIFLLLRPFEMLYFLMPLMHSEKLEDVELYVDVLK